MKIIEESVPALDGADGVLDSALDAAEESAKSGGRFFRKLLFLGVIGLIGYCIYKFVSADNSPPEIDLAQSYGADRDNASADEAAS